MARCLVLGLLALVLAIPAGRAGAQDLNELITEVGEQYAIAYSSPFLHSFGPNANANMYSTAHIPWRGLVFGVGVKVMGTHLSEDDQTFASSVRDVDLGTFNSAFAGQTGDVYFSGPTIFGNTDTPGRVQGFVNGLEVFNTEGIPGIIETRWSPLVAPEAYLGGIFGLKATVRYLPAISAGDLGETKYWGYGLQFSPNGLLPNLPIDVMAGFFTQEINVGTVYESTANTIFAGASKSFTLLTVYGGLATEDSSMDVAYEYIHPTDSSLNTNIAFTIDGIQTTRMTLGLTLDILAKLNLEVGLGNKMTTFSAGLMFGL
jgi:hypothetical protein